MCVIAHPLFNTEHQISAHSFKSRSDSPILLFLQTGMLFRHANEINSYAVPEF